MLAVSFSVRWLDAVERIFMPAIVRELEMKLIYGENGGLENSD